MTHFTSVERENLIAEQLIDLCDKFGFTAYVGVLISDTQTLTVDGAASAAEKAMCERIAETIETKLDEERPNRHSHVKVDLVIEAPIKQTNQHDKQTDY